MTPNLSLEEALIGASEAPPERRIEFRDAIARHGARAVSALEPWLQEPVLAAFAVRAIARAADFGARGEALGGLRRALQSPISAVIDSDLRAAIDRLGGAPPAAPRRSGSSSAGQDRVGAPGQPLVAGRVYRRRDLHASRWGGNRQSGISYPADGEHVLLFSDPSKAREHGYRDRWEGGAYRYYGEWHGTGDMVLSGGNRAIVDRSPELHLFIAAEGLHRYEGQFECVGYEPEMTSRDGREFRAIVFVLRRIRSQEDQQRSSDEGVTS